jgi:DNA-binding transcriptional regulator YdaS (Cro superfamily)
MKFRDYYYSIPVPDRQAYADDLGVTVGYLNLIAQGHRKAGEGLAIDIERKSGGVVTVESLREDLSPQWAYIRGTAKRPTEQAAA